MDRLFKSLQKIPCLTTLPEEKRGLWEMCLSDIWCPSSLAAWRSIVDAPSDAPATMTLFINLPDDERRELTETFGFPTLELPTVPRPEWVNEKLPDHFNAFCTEESNLPKQSQVAEMVTNRVATALPDIVVFLVFDGLSLYDVDGWTFDQSWRVLCEPCLVDGQTATESGMRRLIGSPPVAHRLFALGYTQRMGFSYWERSQNRLTDDLFAEFPPTQLFRVTTFEEVLNQLHASDLTARQFIQIVRTGLDGVCHNHREKPNINILVNQLREDIEQIAEVLRSSQKTAQIFVTADHGILWFKNQKVIPSNLASTSPRYVSEESVSDAPTCTIQENGETFTVLTGDDIIARNRKVTEWGFHGGISAQESLVPFLDISPKW